MTFGGKPFAAAVGLRPAYDSHALGHAGVGLFLRQNGVLPLAASIWPHYDLVGLAAAIWLS